MQSYDFWYQLKYETMSDFWTGNILHFTGPSQFSSVLTDGPTHVLKTVVVIVEKMIVMYALY